MKKIVFTFMALAAHAAVVANTPEQRADDFIHNEIRGCFIDALLDDNEHHIQAVCKTFKDHLLGLDTFIYYSDKQHFAESKQFLKALADYYKICFQCQKVGQWENFLELFLDYEIKKEILLDMIRTAYSYDEQSLHSSKRPLYNVLGEPYYLEPCHHESEALISIMPALKKCFEANSIPVLKK